MKAIDKLPQSSEWNLKAIMIEGDLLGQDGRRQTEEVELWLRNPVDCIRELMANPTFRDAICFEPQQAFDDKEGTQRRYDEMWTANWWWEMQVSGPKNRWCEKFAYSTIVLLRTAFRRVLRWFL
jgi:hypothetical protein